MKVCILAGGIGSRIYEETEFRPKPMVEIGGRPILWHIMRRYYEFGFKEFVIALGYKGDHIKRYFFEEAQLHGDLTLRPSTGHIERSQSSMPDWTVTLVETGLKTGTGGRIKRLAPHLGNDTFMLTWGDGVADIDLNALLAFHRSQGKIATLTAVRPPARFGHLEFDGDQVCEFTEKPQTSEGWINGAYFVLEPGVFDYIDGDMTMFEREPLERLARQRQLSAYRHSSFWQCMDTMRDRVRLERIWDEGPAPWCNWERD